MLNKRLNVFETNSSSVHSITLDGTNVNDIVVSDDGYVHVKLGYFGTNYNEFNNSYDKLCYSILVCCYGYRIPLYCYYPTDCPEDNEGWVECALELVETIDYKRIEDCVVTELNRQNRVCYGIKLEPSNCGIDHQSAYDYEDINEFLTNNNLEDLHEFIFGRAVLHTDSD